MREISNATGAQQLIGYFVQIEDAGARVVLDIEEKHLNRNGSLHGGIIATLLDAGCGYNASLSRDGSTLDPVTTVSMTINYVSRAVSGRVVGTGKVSGGGRKILHVEGQLTDEDGAVVATSTGVFRRLSR